MKKPSENHPTTEKQQKHKQGSTAMQSSGGILVTEGMGEGKHDVLYETPQVNVQVREDRS